MKLSLPLILLLIQLPLQVFAVDSLDLYRQLTGSLLKGRILRYARDCIVHKLDPKREMPKKVPELQELPQTGLYVSLMKGPNVRVCIGGFTPFSNTMENAINDLAGRVTYGDTRTRPLFLAEMGELSIVLSFVGPLREITNPYAIDFTREGLYISQGHRSGVLLPGETRTIEYGLRRLMKQTGIDRKKPCRYASFDVVVFDERIE
jgi:AMMECR1 domain-containing protein